MADDPCAQPGFVLAAASFLTGAALSWLLLVRPLFRHIIERR